MKIIPMLIPVSNKFTRPGISMSPKYITIHETGNTAAGANALAHAKLQQRGNSRQASWHFTCGSDGIYQSIPTNEVAFHAGDGKGLGNYSSIAIEICVNSDGDFTKAKGNSIELVCYLMDKYHIPLKNVVPHQHWSGKNCPRNILKSGWEKFVAQISSKGATKPVVHSKAYPGHVIKFGDKGSLVKEIQTQLGGLACDSVFGKFTDARVREFQKANKLVVDGIVGVNTWKALFN